MVRGSRNDGYTLVELLVALAIGLLAATMFGSAFVVVERASVKQFEGGVTISQTRQALVALDAQMRSGFGANFIEPPPTGYTQQFVIYTPDAGVGRCVGWRLSNLDVETQRQTLQMAVWSADTDSSGAAWSTMATGIRNMVLEPTQKAFGGKGYPADSPVTAIALGVRLWVDAGEEALTSEKKATLFTTTFTTRNIRRYDTEISINGVDVKAYQACA